MTAPRQCACGHEPRWMPAPRTGRARAGLREKLRCMTCGLETYGAMSRERTTLEWDDLVDQKRRAQCQTRHQTR